MHTFSADTLTEQEQYKLLSGAVIPRPIAFVTTVSEEGVVNAAPFSFFNVVSAAPPILMISVNRKNGKQKDTAKNILRNKELVIHITDENTIDDINQTAATLSSAESELDRTTLTKMKSLSISVPSIKESKIRFECKLHQHIPIEDDEGNVTTDVILARVLHYSLEADVFQSDKGYVLPEKLKPVSRLAGNDYATVGELFTLIRPE